MLSSIDKKSSLKFYDSYQNFFMLVFYITYTSYAYTRA